MLWTERVNFFALLYLFVFLFIYLFFFINYLFIYFSDFPDTLNVGFKCGMYLSLLHLVLSVV